ncbi:MAG: N-glycosylase/DNA lyase, partial [Nanoarchaeota archaeon]
WTVTLASPLACMFKALNTKGEKESISEFCFCLLTSNAKSKTACAVQRELGFDGFYTMPHARLVERIKANKHRFHNTKASRIVEGRTHMGIKKTVQGIISTKGIMTAREWLVEHVKGYGYKEASHFLRNVGYDDIAILDRHIMNLMKEHNIVRRLPTSLNRKRYLQFEKKFSSIADAAHMTMAELDMYMWYMKAKDVLK